MEQIAIVGIGCRLPGKSEGPDAYWQNLLAGRDLICETPADRWSLGAYHAIDPAAAGRTYTRWGGFVSRPDEFDAGFFGIAPREAAILAPLVLVRVEVAEEGGVLREVGLDLGHSGARPILEPRLAEVVFDVVKTAFAHGSHDRHAGGRTPWAERLNFPGCGTY